MPHFLHRGQLISELNVYKALSNLQGLPHTWPHYIKSTSVTWLPFLRLEKGYQAGLRSRSRPPGAPRPAPFKPWQVFSTLCLQVRPLVLTPVSHRARGWWTWVICWMLFGGRGLGPITLDLKQTRAHAWCNTDAGFARTEALKMVRE